MNVQQIKAVKDAADAWVDAVETATAAKEFVGREQQKHYIDLAEKARQAFYWLVESLKE